MPEDNKKSFAQRIREQRDAVVEGSLSNQKLLNMTAKVFAEEEIDKRANAIADAVRRITDLEEELNKLKPDQNVLNIDGDVIQTGYSKDQLEKINKLKKKINDLDAAANAAVEGDPKRLFNMLKSKSD